MTDPRYTARYGASGRRSPSFSNPARVSLPTTFSYSDHSMYGTPATATRYSIPVTARPYSTMAVAGAPPPPPTATRTMYAVAKDPVPRTASLGPGSNRTRRSSTLDSATARPVIVTTTGAGSGASRTHGSGNSHNSSARNPSPIRDDSRSRETYFTEPASSIRRGSHRNSYSISSRDNDDYRREYGQHASAYRSSRPPVYPTSGRHGTDYDDYVEYTSPGDLARYDIENSRPSAARQHRRRDSNSAYHRPSVTLTTDQIHGPAGPEIARAYNSNTSRPYEPRTYDRSMPPPSTWGRDKLNRNTVAAGIYDKPDVKMPAIPPAAPAPPPIDPSRRLSNDATQIPERRTSLRRPVSLYQDGPPRSGYHDDLYLARDDDRAYRDRRDREREYGYDPIYVPAHNVDENVTNRGFGIRTDSMEVGYDDPRDPAEVLRKSQADSKRRHDDDLLKRATREETRKKSGETAPREDDRERRGSKEKDEDDRDKKKLRDKMATGLGIAASAIGLGDAVKSKDDKEDKGSPKRRTSAEEKRKETEQVASSSRRGESPPPRDAAVAKDLDDSEARARARREADTRAASRDQSAIEVEEFSGSDDGKPRTRRRIRRESDARPADREQSAMASDESSESDHGKPRTRRRRHSSMFNPNNPDDLRDLRDQMAAMKLAEKQADEKNPGSLRDGSQPLSPVEDAPGTALVRTDRGREVVSPDREEKQVRLVSPARDKAKDSATAAGELAKPIKGILKQPSAKFPEEANPIREGVAPHKEDKKLKEVPAGARWTKINRKIVNPEALTIGKERFEVRDDFVIVLRVLSKEEVQAYANATTVLRERRRQAALEDRQARDRDEDDQDGDEEPRRRHRSSRKDRDDDDDVDDEEEKDREKDREYERERRRRHRRDEEDGDDDRRHEHHHSSHHRSHRDRDRERDRDRDRD